MGIFDPFRDIDRTRAGTPYVVDETGWGWLGIGILTVLPVIGIGCVIKSVATIVIEHPIVSALMYILISFVIGYILYWRKGYRKCWIGCLATVVVLLPILITEMLYEMPMIIRDAVTVGISVNAMLEWGCVTIFVIGISIFVEKMNLIRLSPKRHMIVACIYFVIYIIMAIILMSKERVQICYDIYVLKIL